MATRKKSTRSTTTRRKRPRSGAIALLTADHDKVKKMFKQFEKMHEEGDDSEAEALAKMICQELTVHATIEEEIFYPQVRDAIDDDDLLDEAEVEHASAKDLIAQIEGMSSGDDKFAAKVMVLGEYIDHHVKEEQNEMFPKAQRAKLDMEELGERLLQRKQELQSELGMEEDEQASEMAGMRRTSTSRRAPMRARA